MSKLNRIKTIIIVKENYINLQVEQVRKFAWSTSKWCINSGQAYLNIIEKVTRLFDFGKRNHLIVSNNTQLYYVRYH